MNEEDQLPPLPSSSNEALEKNQYGARTFWGSGSIERIEKAPFKKCEHKFRVTNSGAECTVCHFGLIGSIAVKEEKIIVNGEPVSL